jgi:hypothetical protein
VSAGGPLSTKGVPSGRGTTASTKGMISGAASSSGAQPAPLGNPLELSITTGPIVIVVPTAINTALLATENIVDNLRLSQPANVVLPSMYKRAYFIAYETDETAVVKPST